MLIDSANQHSSSIHTFTDVHTALNPGVDVDTYESGSRIDFIFVNQHLVDLMQSSTTGDTESGKLGSDHFPVDVTLDFRTFLGLPTTNESSSGIEDKSDSPVNFGFFVLPVMLLVAFRFKYNLRKRI